MGLAFPTSHPSSACWPLPTSLPLDLPLPPRRLFQFLRQSSCPQPHVTARSEPRCHTEKRDSWCFCWSRDKGLCNPPRGLFSSSKQADSQGYRGPRLALDPLWRTEDRDAACHRSSARCFSTGGVLVTFRKLSSLVAQVTAQETGHETVLG